MNFQNFQDPPYPSPRYPRQTRSHPYPYPFPYRGPRVPRIAGDNTARLAENPILHAMTRPPYPLPGTTRPSYPLPGTTRPPYPYPFPYRGPPVSTRSRLARLAANPALPEQRQAERRPDADSRYALLATLAANPILPTGPRVAW